MGFMNLGPKNWLGGYAKPHIDTVAVALHLGITLAMSDAAAMTASDAQRIEWMVVFQRLGSRPLSPSTCRWSGTSSRRTCRSSLSLCFSSCYLSLVELSVVTALASQRAYSSKNQVGASEDKAPYKRSHNSKITTVISAL